MPPNSEYSIQSSLGIIPPARRDGLTQNGDIWLEDKKDVDGADGLWRIHDKIYDLTDFINKHPGGSEWLELTKGTDITEAFEVHHITKLPEQMLEKFYKKDAKKKRNAPFTFKNDGFYKTLKSEIAEELKKIPKQSKNTTNFLIDSLLFLQFVFSIVACSYWNFFIGTLAGNLMAMLTIAAHNYLHQKDNFRMYYFHFSLMQVREWRISHVLSHHLHTNTIDDLEISSWEPFLHYLPYDKKTHVRFGSWFIAPLLWMSSFHQALLRRLIPIFKGDIKNVKASDFVAFILPITMYLLSGQSLWYTFLMWNYIVVVGSTHFFFVGLHAAHHHPDIFHDGDQPRATEDYDWGLSQLDAVMDRKEISGSHFLVLTNFGDHALHHLFPTLDHGTLEHLYPTFERVLEKFDVTYRMGSQLDTIFGGFQQLIRVKPNENKPDLKKKY